MNSIQYYSWLNDRREVFLSCTRGIQNVLRQILKKKKKKKSEYGTVTK